jgi:hypothetical protein
MRATACASCRLGPCPYALTDLDQTQIRTREALNRTTGQRPNLDVLDLLGGIVPPVSSFLRRKVQSR